MEDRGCRGRPRKRQVENSFKIRRGPAAPLELADTSGPRYIQLLYGPKSGPSQSHTSGNKDSTMHEEVDQKTGSRCSGWVNQSLKHPTVAEGQNNNGSRVWSAVQVPHVWCCSSANGGGDWINAEELILRSKGQE